MVRINLSILLLLIGSLIGNQNFAQEQKFGFEVTLRKTPLKPTTFCVPNDDETKSLLTRENVKIKYSTASWLFITTTPKWIDDKTRSNELKNYYFEYAPPMAMADSAVYRHHAKEVHSGLGGLSSSYTGKGVILGIVDQGLDWNHPDFIDQNGNTRVLRYWDQTTDFGGPASPYNYGIVWDSTHINNGICTSTENGTAHGTTVAGMAAGNGRANGTNKGFAPEANLIIVESDFGRDNWTLTVADACDYIFKVADTLGMPAVVNLSLGTYLGSHDGNDPASVYMESLLDEKPGRIIVCAAGNSGAQGKYHVRGIASPDTSFVWIQNNTSGSAAFGPNHIYFDLWSDIPDATFEFAFGADRPAPSYGFRGHSDFHGAQSSLGIPILDTIYNQNGNRIATIETITEIEDGSYHMIVFFRNIDSTNYNFRFMTKGTGMYDLWSGTFIGLNNFITSLPSSSIEPDVVNYNMPDSLQTIVSAWNCSEKVISVGNVKNRKAHVDNNGNVYNSDSRPVGMISPNSSKGPNRHNVVKPDVCASGDVTLAAAPLWLLANPGSYNMIDSGGWHARNGGTSMASPCVAGIAALYLEKCSRANYATFKSDLIATAYTDANTGAVPNYAYGYGNPHAQNLLLMNEFSAQIIGEDSLCGDPELLALQSGSALMSAVWSNGYEGLINTINSAGSYSAEVFNSKGCGFKTDTFNVVQLEVLPILPILQSGNTLATLSFTSYQWTLNGMDIPGANSATLNIFPPGGTYTCYCVSDDGCISETPPYSVVLGLTETETQSISIYPNPSNDLITISSEKEVLSITAYDEKGQVVEIIKKDGQTYSIGHLPKGIYHLMISLENEKIYSKITRL
jgi:subtilisin family serine protease